MTPKDQEFEWLDQFKKTNKQPQAPEHYFDLLEESLRKEIPALSTQSKTIRLPYLGIAAGLMLLVLCYYLYSTPQNKALSLDQRFKNADLESLTAYYQEEKIISPLETDSSLPKKNNTSPAPIEISTDEEWLEEISLDELLNQLSDEEIQKLEKQILNKEIKPIQKTIKTPKL